MSISKLKWNINFTNEAMDFINVARIWRSKEFINSGFVVEYDILMVC